MPWDDMMTVERSIEELEKLMPDDRRRTLIALFREMEKGDLEVRLIEGEDGEDPVLYKRILAVGWLEWKEEPQYCFFPNVDDEDDRRIDGALRAALKKARGAEVSAHKLQSLDGHPPKTIAAALYGEREAGGTIVAVAFHPKLRFTQALRVLQKAIAHDESLRDANN